MRITAQQARSEVRLRRRIFDEKVNAAKSEKKDKMAYIERRALDYMDEIMADLELPAPTSLMLGTVRGFEGTDDFLGTNGTIEINGSFQDTSGVKVFFSVNMPLFRGELLRPAVMKVNGKAQVFSKEVFANVLNLAHTSYPVLNDMFLSTQSMTRVDTVNQALYSIKEDDDPRPYFDRYITDREEIR